MTDQNNVVSVRVGDLDAENVTLQAELVPVVAEREIDNAVRGRQGVARKYVRWVRRRNPNATPAEIIAMLERHYVTAISAAGMAIIVGGFAAEVGISFIPGGGAAAAGGKAIAKSVALNAAKAGSQQVVGMLPAGDEQVQFEISAVFALSLADIHGMELDDDQARELVSGLSNGHAGQSQVVNLASQIAYSSVDGLGLSGKRQAAVEHGLGAVVGGATRFVFGREVVDASRLAFPSAPATFPAYLNFEEGAPTEDAEPNRALEALTNAGIAGGKAVGTGVVTAAGVVSRPFRSVDLDGDGVPDEAQALTVAKNVGGAIGKFADKWVKPSGTGRHSGGHSPEPDPPVE